MKYLELSLLHVHVVCQLWALFSRSRLHNYCSYQQDTLCSMFLSGTWLGYWRLDHRMMYSVWIITITRYYEPVHGKRYKFPFLNRSDHLDHLLHKLTESYNLVKVICEQCRYFFRLCRCTRCSGSLLFTKANSYLFSHTG